MNMSEPRSTGVVIAAIVGGILALLIAYSWWNFGGFWAFVFGVIVAALIYLFLPRFWGDAASGGSSGASTTSPAEQPAPAPAPEPAPAPAPETVSEPTASAEAPEAPEPDAPNADAAVTSEPDVKIGSTLLPGEEELASRKGTWKYEAAGADNGAAKVSPDAAEEAAAATIVEPTVADDPADPEPPAAAAAAGDAGPGNKPEMLTAAREGGADDLKQIKGVGPKLESLLNGMGVYHFDQVANWQSDEVAWVDQNLQGFKGRVSRDDWVAQAKVLAAGGTTEFSSKVKKGGVY